VPLLSSATPSCSGASVEPHVAVSFVLSSGSAGADMGSNGGGGAGAGGDDGGGAGAGAGLGGGAGASGAKGAGVRGPLRADPAFRHCFDEVQVSGAPPSAGALRGGAIAFTQWRPHPVHIRCFNREALPFTSSFSSSPSPPACTHVLSVCEFVYVLCVCMCARTCAAQWTCFPWRPFYPRLCPRCLPLGPAGPDPSVSPRARRLVTHQADPQVLPCLRARSGLCAALLEQEARGGKGEVHPCITAGGGQGVGFLQLIGVWFGFVAVLCCGPVCVCRDVWSDIASDALPGSVTVFRRAINLPGVPSGVEHLRVVVARRCDASAGSSGGAPDRCASAFRTHPPTLPPLPVRLTGCIVLWQSLQARLTLHCRVIGCIAADLCCCSLGAVKGTPCVCGPFLPVAPWCCLCLAPARPVKQKDLRF
jgi:hypothetical protein